MDNCRIGLLLVSANTAAYKRGKIIKAAPRMGESGARKGGPYARRRKIIFYV